jgi:hypothetical protein
MIPRNLKVSLRSLLICLVSCVPLAGCSVGAGMGEKVVDTSAVQQGAARTQVIAGLGEPLTTRRDGQWRYMDHHDVVTGRTNTAGHLAGQVVLDVLTFGVWEVLGPSMEMGADRSEWERVFVDYDSDEKVATVWRLKFPRY